MKTFIRYRSFYLYAIGVFILVFTTLSCKVKKPASTEIPAQNILVSFYSIGTGTDKGAINALETLLKKYSDRRQDIPYDVARWGREGEVDYCLHLEKFSTEAFNDFQAELNTLMKDRQVHITPNGGCPNKGF